MDIIWRLENLSIPLTECGCRIWLGEVHTDGYGNIKIGGRKGNGGRRRRVHRVAYEVYKGPIPQHLNVLHHCDMPLCIEPSHLYLGTKRDNFADMAARGRNHARKGPHGRFVKASSDPGRSHSRS